MPEKFQKRTYGEEPEVKGLDFKLIKRLLVFVKPYRWFVLFSVILLFIGKFLENATPKVIQSAIDGPIADKRLDLLTTPVIIFFLLKLFSFVSIFFQVYLTNYVGQQIIRNLRIKLFKHTQSLSMKFFSKNPVGKLMSRIVNDTHVLNELFSAGLVNIFGDIFTLIFIIIFMFTLHVKLTLICLCILPFVIILSMIFKKRVRESFRKIRINTADINTHLQESINGISVIQLFNQQKKHSEKFNVHNLNYLNNFKKTILYFSIFYPLMEMLGAVGIAVIIWYGGRSFLSADITVGILVAFIEYMKKMFQPIRDLAEKYNIMQNSMASSERIFHLLEKNDKDENEISFKNDKNVDLKNIKGKITFKDVDFCYNKEKIILKNINLTVNSGETIAIVGSTGAGKSTMVNLLNRFYVPISGKIQIDDTDINDIPLSKLRSLVGTVSQDIFVFSDSIMENIRLWNSDITADRIKTITNSIAEQGFLNSRLNEILVEKGASLSVGQRQLLSFARILAYDPKIIVLDEATSSIDPYTEKIIQKAIDKIRTNRTCIIVAHRLSTVINADKIAVLHKGEIVEIGTHNELIKKEGVYYRLYRLQFT